MGADRARDRVRYLALDRVARLGAGARFRVAGRLAVRAGARFFDVTALRALTFRETALRR
jgi:hypothetical protein